MGKTRRLGGDRKKISVPRRLVGSIVLGGMFLFVAGMLASPVSEIQMGRDELWVLFEFIIDNPLQALFLAVFLALWIHITSVLLLITLLLISSIAFGWPTFYPGLIVLSDKVFLTTHGRREDWLSDPFWIEDKPEP